MSGKLRVVEDDPGKRLRSHLYAWLAVIVTLCAAAAGGWWVGAGQLQTWKSRTDIAQTRAAALEAEREQLAREVARLERLHQVDQVAIEELRQSLEQLEADRRQMQQDIAFYKGILAPSSGKTGLSIQKFELEQGADERHWPYKLVLTQLGNNKQRINGQVTLSVEGEMEGKRRILSLRELAGTEKLGMPFGFRYFQEFKGELKLPEGFVPRQVQIVAQSRGKKATKVEKAFDWPKES
ncbi:MAG: hypothetical protein D6758_12820 [Gammaproteobacteria bacterium]|nr:MAG: hypothetical protein D6758_12820 [Gammaproteobacteria bacterium]